MMFCQLQKVPLRFLNLSSCRNLIIFLLFFLVFAYSPGLFSQPQAGSSEYQIIHRHEIELSGATRLSDLLLLIADWQVSTTDGFVWDVAAGGLSGFQGQDWMILLNGQRMDVNLLDINNINMLPVSVDQIDSLKAFSSPQLHYGEITDRGLIHIFTRPPQSGAGYRAQLWFGNESGDPGPFIFTRYRSLNKDRLGPEQGHRLWAGSNKWSLQSGIKSHNHYSTDAAILRRNPGRNNQFMWLQMRSWDVRAVYREKDEQHELYLANTTSGNLSGQDSKGASPLFFRQLLSDIPTERSFLHGGISGRIILSPKSSLRYRVQYSFAGIDSSPRSDTPQNIDWANKQINANFESRFDAGGYRIAVGAGWQRMNAESGYELSNDKYSLTRMYARFLRKAPQRWQRSLVVQWLSGELQSSFKGIFNHRYQLTRRQHLHLNLAYTERLFSEDNSLWFWRNRGYRFLADQQVDYSLIGDLTKSKIVAIDAGWQLKADSSFKIQVNGLLRLGQDQYFEQQLFQFDIQNRRFQSPVVLFADTDSRVVGGTLRIAQKFANTVEHKVAINFLQAIGGDDVFQDAFKSQSDWRGRYQIAWQLASSFSIWGALYMASERQWPEYRVIREQSGGVYNDRTPGFYSLDLAAQKWFWDNRFRAHLLCRNLLNQEIRYHPLGADFGLQLYLQFSMAIGFPTDRR